MKVLRLTTSNDVVISGPGSRTDRIERLASERLGEQVTLTTKAVWPDARLGPAVEKWIEKEQPDVVWMLVQSFWFEYVSVPKRLERKFGRVGKTASNVGFKAADVSWLATTLPFRMGRRFLQKTVGGDPHFTVDELYRAVEEVARVSLRGEGRQFVAYGPFSYVNYGTTRAQTRTAIDRRRALIARIRALANELHFAYVAPDRPHWQTRPAMHMHSDLFHFAQDAQQQLAETEVDLLVTVWQSAVSGESPAR